MKTQEGQKVYSLAAPWFDALVKAEQERLDRQKTPALAPPAEAFPSMPTAPTGPRPAFVERPSLLAKLRGL